MRKKKINVSNFSTNRTVGCLISHAYILDNVRRQPHIRAIDIVMPFFGLDGISGIRLLMSTTLNAATRIVNIDPFSPERFFKIVEQFKVSVIATSTSVLPKIFNHPQIETADLSSIKYHVAGGSKVSFDLMKKLSSYYSNGKVCQSYGMSECVGPVAINLQHLRNDCVGQLISGATIKVVSEDGDRLNVGEIGELCIKQAFQFSGYMGGVDNANFDLEGFYLTGDIGYFDKNHDLFIVDRKKAIFKHCGYHVTPTEIETFLDKIDGVKHSCLVPIPDLACENLPAAVIVRENNSNCTEKSIYDAVLSK